MFELLFILVVLSGAGLLLLLLFAAVFIVGALAAAWMLLQSLLRWAFNSALATLLALLLIGAALLSLGGCASVLPHEARQRMLGMNTPDVLACMGPPAERDNTVPRLKVWTWSYTDPGASVALGSMSALGMGVSLQEHGSCRVIVSMSGGHVTSVHYSPAQDGIAGPLGACKAIISDCLAYPTLTPIPADFDPDAPEATMKASEK